MERLTTRHYDGTGCRVPVGDRMCSCDATARLAAYEDTMSLERAQELAQAEKDGRLVVLPCKVGDTVYMIRSEEIIVAEVESIHQWSSGVWKVNAHTNKRYTHWVGYEISFDYFGKTIFLTREEAEETLKKREADNEVD